jgi:hypothetical protein
MEKVSNACGSTVCDIVFHGVVDNEMKVAIFIIEYSLNSNFNEYPTSVPKEFRNGIRIQFFSELIEYSLKKDVDLVVLPGGFFRTDSLVGISNSLKHKSPGLNVLVGRDNTTGSHMEVLVISPSGRIKKRIPEAWESAGEFSQKTFNSIKDRRFRVRNRLFAAYSCGDVIIDQRKTPIIYSEGAFVLAHYSAKGRNFTPAMRKLNMPVFLSHHVSYPYNAHGFAYCGKRNLKPIIEECNTFECNAKQLAWKARLFSI